ncbi:MAG: hypothetical protein K6L73_00080 [Cellvibrionaceae bacterium]
MTDTIIVQLPTNEASPCLWTRVDDNGITGSVIAQSLESLLADAPEDCQWIAIVPGESVRTTHVALPKKRRSQALQALPFMLEDQIASDIQLEHFAAGSDNDAGLTQIAICSKEQIEKWREPFVQASLDLRALIPDYLLVDPLQAEPGFQAEEDSMADAAQALTENDDADSEGTDEKLSEHQHWNIVFCEERAIARNNDGAGFSAPLNQFNTLLNLYAKGEEAEATVTTEADKQPPELPENWQINATHAVVNWFQDVAPKTTAPQLNLLQGAYLPRKPKSDIQWRSWIAAAVIAVVSVMVHLINTKLESDVYAGEANQIRQNMGMLVKDALPHLKRVTDPQAQLEIAWRQVRSQSGGSNSDNFLMLLDTLSPLIREQKLQVQGIRYQDKKLAITLEGKSLQQLDGLREKVQAKVKSKQLNASLENATTGADRARSDLVIATVSAGRSR